MLLKNPGRQFRMKFENKEMANNNHLNDYKSDVNIVSNDRKERERDGKFYKRHLNSVAVKF